MIDPVWLALLPVAAVGGWWAGRRDRGKSKARGDEFSFPSAYFKGLNFLLNEQPDKAIEVFIKMLEVDSETVEMHLTLGNLFRRRGEVERATRIHQNLIARPNLSKNQRIQALYELAQDYFKAGLFDRAESLFMELSEMQAHAEAALRYLSQIYEQEKEWDNAIKVARRLEQHTGKSRTRTIAQYYCELVDEEMARKRFNQARDYVGQARDVHPDCARATIQFGDIDYRLGKYQRAIDTWKELARQDARYLGEIVDKMVDAYAQLDDPSGAEAFLREALEVCEAPGVLIAYVNQLERGRGKAAAVDFLGQWLTQHPSIRGLRRFVELKSEQDAYGEDLRSVQNLLMHMVDSEGAYQCRQCGFSGRSMHWQCPGCKGWHTYEPVSEEYRLRHVN